MSSFKELKNQLDGKYKKKDEGGKQPAKAAAPKTYLVPTPKNESRTEETPMSGGGTGTSQFNDLRSRMEMKYNPNADIDDDFLSRFQTDAKGYLDRTQSDYEQMGGKTYESVFRSRLETTTDLQRRSTVIRNFLNRNKDRLDPEQYQSTIAYLDELGKAMDDSFGYFRNARDTYDSLYGRSQETIEALGAEDFRDHSQYASTKTDDLWEKMWSQYSMGYNDLTYEYINNQGGIRNEISSKQFAYGADTHKESSFARYDYMTDDEIAVYNYYYAKDGKDRAKEYLDSIGARLEARANQETVERVSEFAWEHPVFSSALSVGSSLLSGYEYIGDVAQYGADMLTGKDARLGTNEAALMTNAVRGTVSEKVDWEIKGWDAFDFLYSTAMSGADSLAAGLAFGGYGGAVLGLSSAAQGTNDALERGMSDGQAFWNGLFSGAFECLFETVSIGNFQKLKEVAPDSVKTIFKNLGKSMLVNASEETLTELANIAYDTILNGDFANYTWEELKAGAWKDAVLQVVEAGASGALMGVGMGGVGNAVGTLQAKKTYGEFQQDLVTEALEINPENAYAKQIQERLDSGKNLRGGQLRFLVGQNQAAIDAHGDATWEGEDYERVLEAAENGQDGAKNPGGQITTQTPKAEEVKSSVTLEEVSSKYGAQAQAMVKTFREGQDVAKYDAAYKNAYDMGKSGVSLDYAKKSPATAYLTPEQVELAYEAGTAAQSSFDASGEGNTLLKADGTTIAIQGIESVSGGKMTLKLEDGRTVDASEVAFSSTDESMVYDAVAEMDLDGATADLLVGGYKTGGISAHAYAIGIQQAYRYGQKNFPIADLGRAEYAAKLTEEQRMAAYEAGSAAEYAKAEKAQATVSKKEKVESKPGKVQFLNGGQATELRGYLQQKGKQLKAVQETAIQTMEKLSAALGVDFYVFESYKKDGKRMYIDEKGVERPAPSGKYRSGSGAIYIDLNAGNQGQGIMLYTVAHELTHFIKEWSPVKFKTLADILMAGYAAQGQSVQELVDNQSAKAKRNCRTIDFDTAYEEVVADAMEAVLASGNVVQMMAEVKQQDQTLWQKICDWFRNLAEDLKAMVEAYKGVAPDSREARLVAEVEGFLDTLEMVYAYALVDAGENFQAAGKAEKNTTQEGGEDLYAFRGVNEDGIEVYETSEEVKKLPYKERQLRFLEIMKNEYRGRTAKFIRNGHAYYAAFDEKDVNKNIYGDKRSDPKGWKAKINVGAEGNIFELVENAQYNGSLPESGKKIAAHRGVGYWDYFIKTVQIDDAVYDLVANVRKKADGAYVYSIQLNRNKNKEASPPRGSLLRALDGVPNASKANVAQNAGEVKEKFALRDTVEETRELVAVHNLSEEKLIKSLRLGGLPMPSIAILRSQDGHSEFGDISLVFGKDTIDPEAYRSNKLYSGDAWTPTYPKVDYKISEKVRKQIVKRIDGLVPYDVRTALGRTMLDADNLTDKLNSYGGDIVDAFGRDDGLKYAFLVDNGADITLPMKEESLATYDKVSNEAVRYFSGKLVNGLQTLELYQNMGSREMMASQELTEAVADAYNFDVLRTLEPGSAEYAAYEKDPVFSADDLSFSEIDTLLTATRKLFSNGIKQKVDTRAAQELIRGNVYQAQYEAWLKELFSGIVEKEGIRNNADYFTRSGNRRSFEALHYEHNLENVIRVMKETGEKGVGSFGGGNIFGASTTEFSSIEEMKQSSDRLRQIPEAEYEEMRDGFSNRFFEIASGLPINRGFSALDDAANMLIEAVTKYKTKSGMANYIRREGKGWTTYSDYVVDDLIELVRDIRSMPTGYFEAKPRRAVGFDEVATAIVPNTISDDLRAKLESMGVPFVEYAAGDEEARKTALNSIEDVKFSDRDSDGGELSEEQQEYFRESKVRDEQGRLLVMYHGTPNGGFTKFRSGTYFTQNAEYAEVYQSPGASMLSTKRGADTPMTYKVYLNIKKPFDTRNARERKIFQQEFYRKYGTGTPLADSGLPDWVDGMDLQEFIEEMEYDYDGLILDEGATGGYGMEVKSRGLSYVVFSAEQVKNVENKAPTSNPDIRFSERDPEIEKVNRVLSKENAELKYDIAYLKELLKLQRQVTGGTKFTRSSVEAAAGQLMKYANARGDKKHLAGLLNNVYEYIAGSKELTWDGVKEAAQPAVAWLQANVVTRKERNSYAQDVLKEIRGSRVYLDEQQKQEVAHLYGSVNDFRKKAMGSVFITTKDAVALDTKWQEWASLWPNIFDPDITSNDMPTAMMDAFQSLRSMTEMDAYGYDEELFAQDLLSQVYDSYWRVSTLRTVADAKQKEINRLKGEHAKRMTNLRAYHREKTAQLKSEHRESLQKVRQEARERTKQKLEEQAQRHDASRKNAQENRKKTEMRRKIRRTIMDLDKLLNKGDKKRNVKEGMKDLVTEALRSADVLFTDHYSNEDMVRNGVGTDLTEQEAKYLNEARALMEQIGNLPSGSYEDFQERQEQEPQLQSKLSYRMTKLQDVFTRERARLAKAEVSKVLGDLADAYKSLENSEEDYISDAFNDNVYQYLLAVKNEVGGTLVKDMSLSQLDDLHRAYTMVLTTVRNANKMFAQNLKETRAQLGSRVINEVKKAGGEHGLWFPGEDKISTFSWNNQKPIYAFERIGSETLKALFENTRAGEDTWAQDMAEARGFYLGQTHKHNYDKWDFQKQHKFTSSTGIDFSLNLEQIMSLYAYSKREQAHDHLMKGGFVFDGNTEVQISKMGVKLTYLNKSAKAYKVSPDLLGQIVGKLTDEQKAFVDEMQDYLSTTMGGKGNSISMELYGVKLFNEKHYFPLRSAGQYMERAKEADLKKQQGQISIVNSGFAKSTTPKASNPVVLSGFMDVWADHVNEMSMYHSFVLPMEDFRRVYNYATPNQETGDSVSVNSTIQDAYGEAATNYIDQLYRDLNGGAVSDPRETTAKSLMGKFKKAAVFASASVVIQQPSAIGRAFAIIDPKYFVGGRVDAKRHKALWAELKQYAPVAAIKEMGYFDTGMGKSAQDYIKGKEYKGIKEKAAAIFTDGDYRDEVLGRLPALADELTWCAIWDAAKRETRAKNPRMDVKSEEFLAKAGQRFTEVIVKTQVYDSVLSRSADMRSKGAFMSMWTAFMAEPTTTINMMEDALHKAKKGDKGYAARATGAVLSSIILNSLLVSLVYAMRDDDEDETFLEKYAQSFATEILDGINPLTYYPFLKDVWSAAQGFDIERSDMSLITSLVEKATKLVQVYGKDTEGMDEEELAAHGKEIANAWWGVVDYMTALVGIPVKNVRRDINGAINTYGTISADLTDRDTSWGSLTDKVLSDVKNSIPVIGWLPDKTAADRLYEATVGGDTAYQKRLASSYRTEESLNNAIRKGLRANDSRIWEAAVAWNSNDLASYMSIAKEIIAEGHFSQDNVVDAIQAEAKAMLPNESEDSASKAKGYFTAEKFAVAISQGNNSMASIIREDIISTAQRNCKTREEAEKSFASSARTKVEELFQDGSITKDRAIKALTDYCGKTQEEAAETVAKWGAEKETGIVYNDIDDAFLAGEITESEVRKMYMTYGGYTEEKAIEKAGSLAFERDYPELSERITYTQYKRWQADGEPNGVDIEVFTEVAEFRDDGTSGKTKSQEEVAAYINSLPVSTAQKDALWCCFWKASTLKNAPWR